MRKRTLSAATSFAVLVSSAALVAGTAGQAAADSSKALPLSSVGDMLVDGVHRKIFISDPYLGKVVATDYTGTVLSTVTGLPGVTGLALSPDSGSLYAAVPGADVVVALDPQSVTEQARYATGEGTDPQYVAAAGGRIWFGYGNGDHGDIGSVDTSGAEPVVTLAQDTELNYSGAPRLVSSPTDPNAFAAMSSYYHRFLLGAYDVSTGTATRTARTSPDVGSVGMANDLAYTPDGGRIVTATAGNRHRVWRTTDMAELPSYASEYHGAAVAVAADGTVAAGSDAPYNPDVFVYRPGETKAVRQYDFPNTGVYSGGDGLQNSALAWEPGGSRLFAVTSASSGDSVRLQVLDTPTKSLPTVTVKVPATVVVTKAVTVSGTVAATLGLPAGTPLTVTRYDPEFPKGKALGTRALGANGTFSFTDTPTAAGSATYKVAYAGDATHLGASGTAVVKVTPFTTALTLDQNRRTVNYGTNVTYTATLGWTYRNRVVEIWSDPLGPEPKRLLKRGTVNSAGKLSVTVRMTRDSWVTADFAADTRSARAHAGSTVYTRAGLTTALSRHYKWSKIGTIWYQTYHQTSDPLVTAWHNPYPGRKTQYDLQVWYDGAWRSGGSDLIPLNSGGMVYFAFDGDGAAGIRARVRTAYVDGTSGDNVNTTVYGAWKYFNFTR
ncbi:Ig-like domain repeat protein [Streptomyces sp. SR27]|uniref:YncE family protein n=1 Tax=Streptomyces sp. SR27 TaxID=3076630 RepID=UPI00295BFA01|nr:Ig-like domain repeat protein [Streptomyces sp. SR27]MDV9190682.1 Ig-like domain repeat protein [Streptomyces sp. SR27]